MRFSPAHAVSVFLATALLVAARLYALPENGPPDYDTVANWQVAREIASGHFARLFHHRAPLFNLFFGGVALFTQNLSALIAVNATLNVLAVLLLCQMARRYLGLGPFRLALVVLAVGLGTFLVHSSRYLTIESASLPVCALFLSAYVRRSETGIPRYWYLSLLWLAVGISINYKLVLALPIVLLLEALQPASFLKGKPLVFGIGLLLLPVLVWSAAAVLAGLPWHRYLAAYAGVARFNVPNAAMRTGKFQADVSFYFRYLLGFESPLVWVGLAGYLVAHKPWQYLKKQALALPDVLGVFCLAFLLGMSVLLKAPRGLVFVYGPLYVLGILVLHRLLQKREWVFGGLLLLSAAYSAFLCQRSIYRYSGTGYAQMASEIKNRRITSVVQTVGNGLLPFLAGSQRQIISVSQPGQLAAARQAGVQWVVLDSYYLAANIPGFSELEKLPHVAALPEPGLVSPLFFLEHAEFTGLGFSQTMKRWEQEQAKKYHLYLVKLP